MGLSDFLGDDSLKSLATALKTYGDRGKSPSTGGCDDARKKLEDAGVSTDGMSCDDVQQKMQELQGGSILGNILKTGSPYGAQGGQQPGGGMSSQGGMPVALGYRGVGANTPQVYADSAYAPYGGFDAAHGILPALVQRPGAPGATPTYDYRPTTDVTGSGVTSGAPSPSDPQLAPNGAMVSDGDMLSDRRVKTNVRGGGKRKRGEALTWKSISDAFAKLNGRIDALEQRGRTR